MKKTQINKFRKSYIPYAGPMGQEGLALAVTFDEKDEVKQLGAKWSPAQMAEQGGFWWIPAKLVEKDCPIEDEENWGPGGSGTIMNWLDNHKMVVGPHGGVSATDANAWVDEGPISTHTIRKPGAPNTQRFDVYLHFVGFAIDEGTTVYVAHEKAKELWELSMTDGYRPVIVAEKPVEETV